MNRRSASFMDQLNETPVTFALLLAYVTMAYLTKSLGFDFHTNELVTWGAAAGMLIQDGEWWRLLTHAVNHGNLIHLGMNAYALVTLGPLLERYLGVWRFLVLYAASAVAGCLVALLWNAPWMPLVGGSGALFGMLGAALALQIRGGRTALDFLSNTGSRQLIGIVVLNLIIGLMIPFVSNAAHVGGLIGGFVVIYCFFDTGRRTRIDTTGRLIQIGWIALLLSLVGYQLRPVLRIDYHLEHYLTATDPARKQQLRPLVHNFRYSPTERARLLAAEKEPRTGILGVAALEEYFSYEGITPFSDALARWKHPHHR